MNILSSKLLSVDNAILALHKGKVGVIPTDTVYGLAARAADKFAVKKLYTMKSRVQKPGTIVAASVEQLASLGVPAQILKHVESLWPAPLSIILPLPDTMRYLHQGLGDIGMRVVANPDLNLLLAQTGPLLTSSANLPGEPVSETIEQAQAYFGLSVDFYLDGGSQHDRLSSTLIRLTPEGQMILLREGAVPSTSLPANL